MFDKNNEVRKSVRAFLPEFATALPVTCDLLTKGNLVLHEGVARVFVLGSRGLDGKPRPDSDIDLSLHVDMGLLPADEPKREAFLRDVLETTLHHWRGSVELDLAAVFDKGDCCGLRCFRSVHYDPAIVQKRGIDCFGIYKTQRGFNGYVIEGVDLKMIYPVMMIW